MGEDTKSARELAALRKRLAELEGALVTQEDQTELIVRSGADRVRTFVNDAYCRYYSAEPSELIGGDLLDFVAPEDRQRVREKIARLSPSNPAEVADHRVIRRDGTVAWQEWVDRAIFDERGKIAELQSVGRDITDRVQLEAQLRRAQQMEAIGLLAAGVSHDFNNLLLVILARAELAADGDDPAAHLAEINAAARSAAKLNRQLLTLSRDHVLDLENVDARAILERLLPLLRSLGGGGIEVGLEQSRRSCWIEADPGRIDQVLIQLAANARAAMPGGGRLRIEVQPLRLRDPAELEGRFVQAPPPGPYVQISVTDTGSGIPEESLERVFEPFYRAKEGDGTGLGLSSVWGIVRQHRGYVGVQNVAPRGARFEILLPGREAPHATTELAPPSSAERTFEHILLLEDDDAVRRVVRTALETRGYVVHEARNAAEAHEAIERGVVPDVLVADVEVPGTSGPTLFRELRARMPALRGLFISGHAEDASVHDLLGPRVAYLEKPFSFADLHASVEATGADTLADQTTES